MTRRSRLALGAMALLLLIPSPDAVAHETDGRMPLDRMRMADSGMVMNENTDQRPPGCKTIRGDKEVTVEAGRRYAQAHPGTTWTFDEPTVKAPPCTKLTVTFVNHDEVRHQFMVHGLPVLSYSMGMFSIEVDGPGKMTGTFVTPSEEKTYRVHCGVPGHESQGMKMQLVVGSGSGNLANIPGLSSASIWPGFELNTSFFAAGGVGILLGSLLLVLGTVIRRRWAKR